ncbi:MAG: hypothetical protein DRJ31_09370 [Candidatus Methanomethylicota archaeon]|uniref:Uncharacterized protein n=1 Tax=Thermoproteota archaeon TaxID=2056631 RepID=A0A497EMJ9_9CREN|nr:MAG: hypothetical protein DRJ31_09370 [Candidatus Verstraetearchaeota archaeon]
MVKLKVIPGMILAKAPPWTRKRTLAGFIVKNGPPWLGRPEELSPAQLAVVVDFAEKAHRLYGTTGKMNYKGVDMPAIAVKLAGEMKKGVGAYGGVSPEDRRRERYTRTERVSLPHLRSLLEKKRAEITRAGMRLVTGE